MKKSILFFIFIILFILSSFCQNQSKSDSLETALKSANQDTVRISLLNSLAKEYQNTEPEKAMQCAQQALKMAQNLLPLKKVEDQTGAQQIENAIKKGMADAYNRIGALEVNKNNYPNALKNFQEALAIRKQIGDLKLIAKSYYAFGFLYYEQTDYTKALTYYFKALDIAEKIEDKEVMGACYNYLGNIYSEQNKYTDALEYHFKSLKIEEEMGKKAGMADSYNNIALIYRAQNKSEDSYRMFLKTLKLSEELKDSKRMGMACVNIGLMYQDQNNYTSAIKFFLQALKVYEEIKYKKGLAYCYNNLGNTYFHQKKYSEALDMHLKSLKIKEEIHDKRGISSSLLNIGRSYSEQGKYKEALNYLERSIKIKEEIGDKSGIANVSINIAEVYIQQKQYPKALDFIRKGFEIAKEVGAKEVIEDAYKGYAEIYAKLGNYPKAYEFHNLYSDIKDSILNENNLKHINELSAKYENEKKEQEIVLLNKDKKIQETQFQAELKQQTILRNVFIGGFVLVLLLAFVSVVGYRQKIKSNAIIALKNEEISKQKANITGQEEERKRIAKELHDGIGGTLAAIKLNLTRINSSSENSFELESTITNIGDACKEIRTISHNLAPPALSNSSFVDVLKTLIPRFIVPGKINIHFECYPEDELDQIPENIQTDIYRILQELLTNIIKHANASNVEIDLSKQENDLYLLVEDNGKGFDKSVAGKGIGLQNMESRINLHKGEIVFDSKMGRGTAVNIHVPLLDKPENSNILV